MNRAERIAELKEGIKTHKWALDRDTFYFSEICKGLPRIDPLFLSAEEDDARRIRKLEAELAALEA